VWEKTNHTCTSVEGKETASPSRRLGLPGLKKNGKKYVAERHRTKKISNSSPHKTIFITSTFMQWQCKYVLLNQIQHKSILTDIEFCQNSRQETYTQTHWLAEVHCSA